MFVGFFSVEGWQTSLKYDYAKMYTHIPSFLIGMVVGYLLYHYKDEKKMEPSFKTVSFTFLQTKI